MITKPWPFILIVALVFAFGYPLAGADAQEFQRIEIPSSPNPVGSGARALGMGGAFIAIADDATAASWNPGGLIQLETPEISIVGAYFDRAEDHYFGTNPEASGKRSVSDGRLNYLSASYPFSLWRRNMIVSVNYQNLYDFTAKGDFPFRQTSGSGRLSLDQHLSYDVDGTLSAIGLAYCIQVLPQFSLGFTLNFWEDGIYENEWEVNQSNIGTGNFSGRSLAVSSYSTDRYAFSGINFNVGILWNMTPKITLGAVLKTPFKADLDHEKDYVSTTSFPDNPLLSSTVGEKYNREEKLEMPMSYGIGLAYRVSDELTFSADIYRTEWDDFVLTDADGNEMSPITGESAATADISETHQVRLGMEYLFIGEKYIVPIRGGIFYDPAPATGSPDDFFGFSIGSGIVIRQFVFDAAYQYRFAENVGSSALKSLQFAQDVQEHTLYASIIYHF